MAVAKSAGGTSFAGDFIVAVIVQVGGEKAEEFVETVSARTETVVVAQVPLTEVRGAISGYLQLTRKRRRLRVEEVGHFSARVPFFLS